MAKDGPDIFPLHAENCQQSPYLLTRRRDEAESSVDTDGDKKEASVVEIHQGYIQGFPICAKYILVDHGLSGEKNIRYIYVEMSLLIHWGLSSLPKFMASPLENLDTYTFLWGYGYN